MVKTTGPQRPDRGTIGKSARSRDYRMSTYGFTSPCGFSMLRNSRLAGRREARSDAQGQNCSDEWNS